MPFFCAYWTDQIRFRWSRGSICTSSSQSEVLPFPSVLTFYAIVCLCSCILISCRVIYIDPGKSDFCFDYFHVECVVWKHETRLCALCLFIFLQQVHVMRSACTKLEKFTEGWHKYCRLSIMGIYYQHYTCHSSCRYVYLMPFAIAW